MALMYDDMAFKKEWMSRKRGINIDDRVSPRSIYIKPPSLRKVQWTFWTWNSSGNTRTYNQEELDVDDELLFDTVNIQNSEDEASASEV